MLSRCNQYMFQYITVILLLTFYMAPDADGGERRRLRRSRPTVLAATDQATDQIGDDTDLAATQEAPAAPDALLPTPRQLDVPPPATGLYNPFAEISTMAPPANQRGQRDYQAARVDMTAAGHGGRPVSMAREASSTGATSRSRIAARTRRSHDDSPEARQSEPRPERTILPRTRRAGAPGSIDEPTETSGRSRALRPNRSRNNRPAGPAPRPTEPAARPTELAAPSEWVPLGNHTKTTPPDFDKEMTPRRLQSFERIEAPKAAPTGQADIWNDPFYDEDARTDDKYQSLAEIAPAPADDQDAASSRTVGAARDVPSAPAVLDRSSEISAPAERAWRQESVDNALPRSAPVPDRAATEPEPPPLPPAMTASYDALGEPWRQPPTTPPTPAEVERYRIRLENRLLERYNNLPDFAGTVSKVTVVLSRPLETSMDGSMIRAEFDQLVYDPWGRRIPELEQEYFAVTFASGGVQQLRSDPSIRVGLDMEKTYSERAPLTADPFRAGPLGTTASPSSEAFGAVPGKKMPEWWRPVGE